MSGTDREFNLEQFARALAPAYGTAQKFNSLLLERMDGGRFHTVHSATTKAVCSASNQRPTASHGAQAQALDTAHALGLALAAGPERWTAMEGGCPIIVEGECIGGIGVSGGDWETDERIAQDNGAANVVFRTAPPNCPEEARGC
jgi:uncharacterized protein GlcG (DUF336 family)